MATSKFKIEQAKKDAEILNQIKKLETQNKNLNTELIALNVKYQTTQDIVRAASINESTIRSKINAGANNADGLSYLDVKSILKLQIPQKISWNWWRKIKKYRDIKVSSCGINCLDIDLQDLLEEIIGDAFEVGKSGIYCENGQFFKATKLRELPNEKIEIQILDIENSKNPYDFSKTSGEAGYSWKYSDSVKKSSKIIDKDWFVEFKANRECIGAIVDMLPYLPFLISTGFQILTNSSQVINKAIMKVRNTKTAADELALFYDSTEPLILQIVDEQTQDGENKFSEETRGNEISKVLINLIQVYRYMDEILLKYVGLPSGTSKSGALSNEFSANSAEWVYLALDWYKRVDCFIWKIKTKWNLDILVQEHINPVNAIAHLGANENPNGAPTDNSNSVNKSGSADKTAEISEGNEK